MELKYERATENDAKDIRYIGAVSWKETYSGLVSDEYLNNKVKHYEDKVEHEKELLRDKNFNYYIVKVDGETVGYVLYCPFEDEKYKKYGHINGLYLLNKYHGLGIGKELFRIALIGLKELGYNEMILECMAGNKTVDFYKKYTGEIIDNEVVTLGNGEKVNADVMLFEIDSTLKTMNSKNKLK